MGHRSRTGTGTGSLLIILPLFTQPALIRFRVEEGGGTPYGVPDGVREECQDYVFHIAKLPLCNKCNTFPIDILCRNGLYF